jgi:hypothetical protein
MQRPGEMPGRANELQGSVDSNALNISSRPLAQGLTGSHPKRPLVAALHPPPLKPGYRNVYSVTFRGERIVTRSRDPEHDLVRALVARGITGSVKILDAVTGRHRSTIPDIEKAARFTVEEGPLRACPYRPRGRSGRVRAHAAGLCGRLGVSP